MILIFSPKVSSVISVRNYSKQSEDNSLSRLNFELESNNHHSNRYKHTRPLNEERFKQFKVLSYTT